MDYNDLTAVTFWQVMQRHLSECRRWYDEAYEWECLITRKKIKGYGCVDIEFAEGEVKSLQKLGDAHSNALQSQWKRYQEFQQYVFNKLPSKFTSLPVANCDDISKIEPRVVALAIELILREIQPREKVPLSTLALELDVSRQSLYRLRDAGHIKPEGKPLFIYRDQIDVAEIQRLLELQKKQQLGGQK
jgi:hypothetical protein